MAKRTVKPFDNLLEIAKEYGISPQSIMKANGVTSLTLGQTLKIPNFGKVGGGLGLSQPNAMQLLTGNYNIANTLPQGAIGYTGISGSNEPYRGQPIGIQSATLDNASITGGGAQKVNPSLIQNGFTGDEPPQAGYAGFQTPTTNGFRVPQGQMVLGQNTVIPANNGIPQGVGNSNLGTSNGSGGSAAPSAVYTGGNTPEAIAQRALWNQQAGASPERALELAKNPPVRMTRGQVWEMKANQRRRQGGKGGGAVTAVTAVPPVPIMGGNAQNVNVSWRVG